jgi:hypothetical protein
MATARTAKSSLLGAWRIVETELWDVNDLDLMEPAHVTLKPNGHGRLRLLAIEAELDYRVVQRDGLSRAFAPTCGESRVVALMEEESTAKLLSIKDRPAAPRDRITFIKALEGEFDRFGRSIRH